MHPDAIQKRRLVTTGLVFNLFWLVAVLGKNEYLWLLSLALCVYWVTLRPDCRFALIGISMDAALSSLQVYRFDSAFFPLWLVLLWAGFTAFAWELRAVILSFRPGVIIVAGGVGGLMSYWAALRLDAVSWPLGMPVTGAITLVSWLAYSLFLVVFLASYTNKVSKKVPEHRSE